MTYLFDLPTPSVAVQGTDARFPVRRIFCVGRNYEDHAKEFGNNPKDPPFFFTKPADAVIESGAKLPFPVATENLHFEAELVVAIGTDGSAINRDTALDHVFGYAAGNDLTRRDLQAQAKETRRPWDMAKGFDNSAVIGAITPIADWNRDTARITCTLEGEVKQDADIADMTWPVPDIIAYLSRLVHLRAGDLIMTGTPAGVGQIRPGQVCTVKIEGLAEATVTLG
ncbi:fumarylacetoacetate hydrolase family protein [Cognatishimia sp. MH4019]|uniref:fumarylacetoacetate hydrolase family protein n=1 Tax=Cognatishimia sp. MH4019 TaxID=2854030 RepID=UPI001CD580ED|nr:fumarylacetoacetate hydrolase family protein [Cognatishimia sp. MH4019]